MTLRQLHRAIDRNRGRQQSRAHALGRVVGGVFLSNLRNDGQERARRLRQRAGFAVQRAGA